MVTPTGYTNGAIFPLMVQRFEEDFHLRYPGLRAVIYLDRLRSHVTAPLLSSMEQRLVFLVLFPAGTTQFLQPADDDVFALFKNLLRKYRDEDISSDPLRTHLADNTLLTAMMRAVKDCLKPEVIKSSFANTGIYPWNPEIILQKARTAFPNRETVLADLPTPVQEMITAILETTPRNQKVAVSKFRKHEHS